MNRQTKDEIRKRTSEIVASLREKYGTDSSVENLERIVREELGIPCKGFDSFELYPPTCTFQNKKPVRISYNGILKETREYILAHEMGHAFLGGDSNEFGADEFATQITGTHRLKAHLLAGMGGIVSYLLLFPWMILDTIKGEHRKYHKELRDSYK